MRHQNRHICLLIDNFSAHYVDYQPRNIEVEFFEPNMTSHVQPCDAGIIRTTKALYRKSFCLWAIEEDEAGKRDIYKIDLLKAMLMAKEAWAQVDASTIAHCWRHTKILPDTPDSTVCASASSGETVLLEGDDIAAMKEVRAWEVVKEFAISEDIGLPQAEESLQSLLGDRYVNADWEPVLKVVMDAENDGVKALEGLDQLTEKLFGLKISQLSNNSSALTRQEPYAFAPSLMPPQQLSEAENDLNNAVDDLKRRNQIVGTPLTLEEILDPIEEREISDSEYRFEGGDNDIVDQVNHEMAVKKGEIVEIEEEEEAEADVGIGEIIQMCEQVARLSHKYGDVETSLDLSRNLRQLRSS